MAVAMVMAIATIMVMATVIVMVTASRTMAFLSVTMITLSTKLMSSRSQLAKSSR